MTVPNSIDLTKITRFLLVVLILTSFCCSSPKSEYKEWAEQELASGVIHDSLVFNLKLGQTKKEFFETCWKLNKKGIIKQGPNNKFVEYKLPLKNNQNLKDAVNMLFYGIFDNGNLMTGMNFQFYHTAWSLWNKDLQSDQLVHSVKDSLTKWYPGNDFRAITLPKDTVESLIKIDGNRRIIIKPLDDPRIVKARIDDLRHYRE
ncbi:hypothetical protein [Euzebyella saccharophila]|uniref:hypothetical protein n=1 Tax=Euzebyella saccharophila TaxID=679664 RepID=UPI00177FCC7F|nr:hypothetical protein [Euzebyella saccharophila]